MKTVPEVCRNSALESCLESNRGMSFRQRDFFHLTDPEELLHVVQADSVSGDIEHASASDGFSCFLPRRHRDGHTSAQGRRKNQRIRRQVVAIRADKLRSDSRLHTEDIAVIETQPVVAEIACQNRRLAFRLRHTPPKRSATARNFDISSAAGLGCPSVRVSPRPSFSIWTSR